MRYVTLWLLVCGLSLAAASNSDEEYEDIILEAGSIHDIGRGWLEGLTIEIVYDENSIENSGEDRWVRLYLPAQKENTTTEPPRTTPEGTTTTTTTTTPMTTTTTTELQRTTPEGTTTTTTTTTPMTTTTTTDADSNQDFSQDSSEEGWVYLPVQKATTTTELPRTTPEGTTTTTTTTTTPMTTTTTTDENSIEDSTEDSDEGWVYLPVQKATTTTEPSRTTPERTTTTSTTTTTTTTEPPRTTPEGTTATSVITTTTEQLQTTTDPPSKSSTTAKVLKLSCQQIRQFVDGHNSMRLQVANGTIPRQPAAESMKSMIWDEELAAKASRWASQNPSGHNPDETVESGKYSTGENIYIFMTTDVSYTFNVKKALEAWFVEHKDYSYGSLKLSDLSADKAKIGHYTQMVWSESTHVGCGVALRRTGYNKYIVVCNYGPAGNWIGQEPYRSGLGAGALVCGAGDCTKQYGDKC